MISGSVTVTGPPCCNLFLKKWNDTSIASKHISKPDSHKICLRVSVEALNDHLADSLGCSHDVGRIDCFIGRYLYKFFYFPAVCRQDQIVSPKNIIFDCFIRTRLHQWHMFVCSSVINDIRSILSKNRIYSLFITNRSNQHSQFQIWIFHFQFLLNVICIVFIYIKYDQTLWFMRSNLSTKFAANRAAATSH